MIMMLSFLIPFFIVMYMDKTGALPELSSRQISMNMLLGLVVLAALAIYAIALLLALGIYNKKEL